MDSASPISTVPISLGELTLTVTSNRLRRLPIFTHFTGQCAGTSLSAIPISTGRMGIMEKLCGPAVATSTVMTFAMSRAEVKIAGAFAIPMTNAPTLVGVGWAIVI